MDDITNRIGLNLDPEIDFASVNSHVRLFFYSPTVVCRLLLINGLARRLRARMLYCRV